MQVEGSDSYDFGTRILTFVSVNRVCLTCSHVQQAKKNLPWSRKFWAPRTDGLDCSFVVDGNEPKFRHNMKVIRRH